jgi:carboxymethylenebutenolidase
MKAFIVLAALLVGAVAPAQDWAKQRLEDSPRHKEWVAIPSGERTVHSYVVYPEIREKAPVVLVIHEIMGMTDWIQVVADRLAEAGYIAIAPDLLSGMGPNGGRTNAFADTSAIGEAIRALPRAQKLSDLDAVADYGIKLPAANGKIAVAGFCWGGTEAWVYANHRKDLSASFVFYGTGPQQASEVANITHPVYGFYGENDARVNTTIERSVELMKEAGKTFDYVIYEGAGHGFLRAGEAPNASSANAEGFRRGWERWLGILKKI